MVKILLPYQKIEKKIERMKRPIIDIEKLKKEDIKKIFQYEDRLKENLLKFIKEMETTFSKENLSAQEIKDDMKKAHYWLMKSREIPKDLEKTDMEIVFKMRKENYIRSFDERVLKPRFWKIHKWVWLRFIFEQLEKDEIINKILNLNLNWGKRKIDRNMYENIIKNNLKIFYIILFSRNINGRKIENDEIKDITLLQASEIKEITKIIFISDMYDELVSQHGMNIKFLYLHHFHMKKQTIQEIDKLRFMDTKETKEFIKGIDSIKVIR